MNKAEDTITLDRLFDPVSRCFTADVAREVAALRAEPGLQARIDVLAEKTNQGELSPQEREEYELYVRGSHVLALLQAKARKQLAQQAAGRWMPTSGGRCGSARETDASTAG